MKLCEDYNHSDIAYESKSCPLCEALDQIKELEKELEQARDAIDNHG